MERQTNELVRVSFFSEHPRSASPLIPVDSFRFLQRGPLNQDPYGPTHYMDGYLRYQRLNFEQVNATGDSRGKIEVFHRGLGPFLAYIPRMRRDRGALSLLFGGEPHQPFFEQTYREYMAGDIYAEDPNLINTLESVGIEMVLF